MQEMTMYNEKIEKVLSNINRVMIGKQQEAVLSLVALLADGHVLLEDVPGVGKTMLVRTLAKSLDCDFRRIQFTPDLLPSDVTGVSIYNPREMTFEFRPGAIFGNIVLADEINRTSPKTQSALLEGMEEEHVTVDGNTVSLNRPFFVMATQNPIEYEGTYPLPEAQLDRFLLKMRMGYPTLEEEVAMLEGAGSSHPVDQIDPVMTQEQLMEAQQEANAVYVDESIRWYIVQLAAVTRDDPAIYLGSSPRASISLMKAAKAYAYLHARDFVLPDDVKYLAPYVLSHRILLTSEAQYDGMTSERVIQKIAENTDIPIRKEFNG